MGSWGQAGKDGLTGAAIGASAGPYGAAIGGALGAAYGGFIAGDDSSNSTAGNPYYELDRRRLGTMLQGQSPYAGSEWGGLVSQLQARASGSAPSVAQMQYQQAMGHMSSQLAGAAHGGAGPGAFHQAAIQAGQAGQGMASGVAQARVNEMQGAQGQLSSALGTRDTINSQAYQNILAQQLGLSQQQINAHLGIQNANNQATAAQYQALGTGLTLAASMNRGSGTQAPAPAPAPGSSTPGVTMSGGSGTYYSPG